MNKETINLASNETDVSSLYQDIQVAESYIEKRFTYSWQQLLHRTQVGELNKVLRRYKPISVLEIAPGPARLATELNGIKRGTMLEYSEEMLAIARKRLQASGLENTWTVIHGNAFELNRLNESFKFIYTFRFIRHFYSDDRFRLYKGIRDRLTPGGHLVFDVVNKHTRDLLDAIAPPTKDSDSLPVYDVSYSEKSFRQEMDQHGFTVIRLQPVLPFFRIQSGISSKFDDIVPRLSGAIVRIIENIPSKTPLEWVALCQKNN
jgi:ubiquinone/menaquinone biosynthesis C-methylase UbiE